MTVKEKRTEDLEVPVKYNLTWDKSSSYEPISRSVLVNDDTIFGYNDWVFARTVAGLLNSAYNMGKMAGMLETQSFKNVREDIIGIIDAHDV